MRIALGADPFGHALRDVVREHLEAAGHEVVDHGGAPDGERAYYEIAHEVGAAVSSGVVDRAVLVCGTGMGMAIIANKHKGVFAAVCEDPVTAERARSVNNANVLTLGEMVTAPFQAKAIVDRFLDTPFTSGWGDDVREFLERSMGDIAAIEGETLR